MNILYLSVYDPRLTDFGGALRSHLMWEALKKEHTVYTVLFDQQFKTEEIAPQIWHVKILQKVNPIRDFFYRLERKALRTLRVLPYGMIPAKLEKTIDETFPGVRFDAVVSRYGSDLMNMHLWNFPKKYVDFDDYPLEIYTTLKYREVPRLLRPLGRWIIKLQLSLCLKKIDGGWLSNPQQARMLKCKKNSIAGLKNTALSPSEGYNTESSREPMLVIVGAMSYYPNYTGVDKFLDEIWTTVSKQFPVLKLAIIGRGTPVEYSKRWESYSNVKQLGYVNDLQSLYERCLAVVVPIYSGGGTCVKTIEAMSHSRVCLSSRFGARGLEECLNMKIKGLQVFESVDDFIALLNHYVLDSNNRLIAEQEGCNYINDNYSKDVFIDTVLSTINEK